MLSFSGSSGAHSFGEAAVSCVESNLLTADVWTSPRPMQASRIQGSILPRRSWRASIPWCTSLIVSALPLLGWPSVNHSAAALRASGTSSTFRGTIGTMQLPTSASPLATANLVSSPQWKADTWPCFVASANFVSDYERWRCQTQDSQQWGFRAVAWTWDPPSLSVLLRHYPTQLLPPRPLILSSSSPSCWTPLWILISSGFLTHMCEHYSTPLQRIGGPNLLRMWSRLWSISVPWHRSWHPISCSTRTLRFMALMDGGSWESYLIWPGHFSQMELGIEKNSLAPPRLSTGGPVSESRTPSSSSSTSPSPELLDNYGGMLRGFTPSRGPLPCSSFIPPMLGCGPSSWTNCDDMQNGTTRWLPLQGSLLHRFSTRLNLGMPLSELPWRTSQPG